MYLYVTLEVCQIFPDRFSKNPEVFSFTKARPVFQVGRQKEGQTDRKTDRHDDNNNNQYSQFCKRA